MDPRFLRPESHVAQQSRRDKLRFQQSSNPVPHLDDLPSNLDRFSAHPGLHPSLVQVRNVGNDVMLYDPTGFNSVMLNFATSSSNIVHQELGAVQTSKPIPAEDSSFTIMSSLNDSPKANTGDPQGSGNWRNPDSTQGYDCMVSYAESVGGVRNQKSMFAGDVLSNNARASSINPPSTSAQYMKHTGYQGVHLQTSLGNPSFELGQDSQKQLREMPFISHSLHQNASQNVVTSGAIVGNEQFLSSYGDQLANLPYDTASNAWLSRATENFNQFSTEQLRKIAVDANTQGGLSLSLSSNPLYKVGVAQFGERYEAQHLAVRNSVSKESEDSKFAISNYLAPMPKPSLDDVVGTSTQTLRNTGPLGPFTGYAIILKSSRFLKPAQELLDEFCSVASPNLVRPCELSEMTSGEISTPSSANAAIAPDDTKTGAHRENNSGISSSTFYSSNEGSVGCRAGSSSCESYRPENLQKKARLLYLQDEVCRRYRQYQQQMQMVASSFESVAGLSAATPYISLAHKTVSTNFRSLKHAISDQLKHVTKSLGEDMLSTNTNNGKGEMSLSRLRYMDHSFQKYKSDGVSVGFLEPQQHIWRPQRGLPERSVAILRAWLFEHFLHPYPTDADKHMLATQTGLSRNQVSNWFINARVRVWKPMVEEIHTLETKCLSETNQSSRKNDGNYTEGCSQPNGDQSSTKFGANLMPNKQLERSGTSSMLHEQQDADQWNQEKRSRVEFQVPSSIDGSLMTYMPFQRNGIDGGSHGAAVSLTLGLQHGVANAQQQHRQQLQDHENQFSRQFGGPMIHDYEG